ncbi:hypothetical protein P8452_71203 [Trifolium repens]|nr:hypothetical protein P8452_71203 [Trifolium repens]
MSVKIQSHLIVHQIHRSMNFLLVMAGYVDLPSRANGIRPFKVEINIRQDFTGSLKCQPLKNDWYEMLKLNGWLSSQLFKEQFPAHFAEVIDNEGD